MTAEEAIRTLEALGTAQNRKVYPRHGIPEPMFGVSFANLRKLARRIKVDHALAETLWGTGNHDSRILATMIADSEAASASDLDRWARTLDNYVLTSSFARFVIRSSHARAKAEKWMQSPKEFVAQAGYDLLGHLAEGAPNLGDTYFGRRIEVIEATIHQSKNRTRYAMNGALISIGARSERLRDLALAAAERIGKVEVDHGETSCKTPDAVRQIPQLFEERSAQTS